MHHCIPERSALGSGVVAKRLFTGTITLVIVTLALLTSLAPAMAAFPQRAITLIVPFAAGGGTDAIARIVAEHMAKTLGHAIIIENVPGAGGTTATIRTARATAD